VVPNFRTLGPRLGPKVNEVKRALAEADGSVLQRQLEAQGWVELAGERLTADDVEVRATRHEDFALAQEGSWAVALDLDVDEALRVEGVARELVRALNDLRKEVGLALSDRIQVRLRGGPRVEAALSAHGEWIAAETLAVTLDRGEGAHHLDVDGETAQVDLVPVDHSPTG
jgi:isoleucyl-tRNA synthetase